MPDATLDDLLEAGERATADEQDVRGIDRQELLLRVLASALGGHGGHRALDELKQRLLNTLTGDVTRVMDGLSDLREILSISSM